MRRLGLPVDRLPDEAPLAGPATGDSEIVQAFVRRFQRRLFGVAVTVLGDSRLAEDMVQLAVQQQQQQNAAMPKSITIREVPDETSDELAARAALTGRSLQEYLRAQLIELAAAPDAAAWLARVRSRKATTGGVISVEQILAHRDADRA